MILCLSQLTACAAWQDDDSRFRSREDDYQTAESLKAPIKRPGGVPIASQSLYPVYFDDNNLAVDTGDAIQSKDLITGVPRVASLLIPLEQGAIRLIRREQQDVVQFSGLYPIQNLKNYTQEYWANKQVSVNNKPAPTKSGHSSFKLITHWAEAEQLEYPKPSFWGRLKGQRRFQHQYQYIFSPVTNAQSGEGVFEWAVKIAHRTRKSDNAKPNKWLTDISSDSLLNQETMDWVAFAQDQLADQTAQTNTLATNIEKDGNDYPYLAINARFARTWDYLITKVQTVGWKINDRDRSKGVIFVDTTNDKWLKEQKVKSLRIVTLPTEQSMSITVEQDQDIPADKALANYVLDKLKVVPPKATSKK